MLVPDVPVPSKYGLHYEDLELKTSDNVLLRCYLIPQKKDLGVGSIHVDVKEGVTEEAVSLLVLLIASISFFHLL